MVHGLWCYVLSMVWSAHIRHASRARLRTPGKDMNMHMRNGLPGVFAVLDAKLTRGRTICLLEYYLNMAHSRPQVIHLGLSHIFRARDDAAWCDQDVPSNKGTEVDKCYGLSA
mmetsp:Transcript_7057/g.21694  ORF Transcript_7057/g.21694 Transcript_7057/m.21694 type:complete len:113 (+) Transcript_7057:669-1007(+)